MWSDNETPSDFLGFHHLVSGVLSIVQQDHLLPATIGVYGDWGSGKSSLLQMVGKAIEQDQAALVLSFNGWLFEGYEDAKVALMGTILDEIKRKRTLASKAKNLFEKLARRVNWFRLLAPAAKYALAYAVAGPAGIGFMGAGDAASVATQAAAKVKDIDPEEVRGLLREAGGEELRTGVRDFRNDFQELLEETKITRLIVIVDDLDRCLPDTIIETLEAIKLFLFVPQTAFIIGADERLVKYAVRRRFPELPGENVEVGRDYLEKLIQFPIHIPPLDACELETYINLLFAKAAGLPDADFEKVRTRALQCDAGSLMTVRFNLGVAREVLPAVSQELENSLGLAERIAPVLASGLSGNPRQCKRFLNTLVMRTAMAKSRNLTLQQRVLAKLMLLEHFKLEWFKKLAELQAAEFGRPQVLAVLERSARGLPAAPQTPEGGQQDDGRPAKGAKRETRATKAGPTETGAQTPASDLGEYALWLSDPWMREWLSSAPTLANEDLRPYFFFSRDTLGSLGSPVRRMTPRAQETLSKLLDESDAQRLVAVRESPSLSPADTAAVFEALSTRLSQEEDWSATSSALPRILQWVEARGELRGQLVSLLGRLPASQLPMTLPMKILSIMRGTESEAPARQLFERWTTTSNTDLARAARNALARPGA